MEGVCSESVYVYAVSYTHLHTAPNYVDLKSPPNGVKRVTEAITLTITFIKPAVNTGACVWVSATGVARVAWLSSRSDLGNSKNDQLDSNYTGV